MVAGAIELSVPVFFHGGSVWHLWFSVYRVNHCGFAFALTELTRVRLLHVWVQKKAPTGDPR